MLLLQCARTPHRVDSPLEKLLLRGRLPGASGYDLAAQSFRIARAHGVPTLDLLPPAMPVSWMVNNKVTSPIFQRWLAPALRSVWAELLEKLEGGTEAWRTREESDRAAVTRCVSLLSLDGHGIAAVSKVLAALCPETVPLMDDAVVAMALDAVATPADADHPLAGPRWFVPMLDWFAHAVVEHENALVRFARDYDLAPLDAAQVLDRLLWFESWGWRLPIGPGKERWERIADEDMVAVVKITAAGA